MILPCVFVKRPLKLNTKNGFQYRLSLNVGQKYRKMEHSAILSTFIKLPFSTKTFVLSIFKWQFKTDFTVYLPNFSSICILIFSGCPVGYKCTINQPCHALRPCKHGEYYECASACHAYAVCVSGRLYLTYCTRGQTYDPKSKTCVPGYCNMRATGTRNLLSQRLSRRRKPKWNVRG